MIETTLCATSEKLKPGACSTFGAPRNSSATEDREEAFDGRAAFGRAQVAAHGLTALRFDRERVVCVVEAGAQPGQPLVAHQHQIALLGLMTRCGGVEAGRPVLDGVEAIAPRGFVGPTPPAPEPR